MRKVKMRVLVSLILILFSLEWHFSNSLTIQKADDSSKVAQKSLKTYLKTKLAKPKIHFQWVKPKYWKERKAKFNFCGRTRGEKLHLCREVLGSAEYNNLEIDGTRPDPTKCKKRKFTFLGQPDLDKTEGIQILKMYPCITNTNPKERYFLSGTGDPEPSLYLFYEDPERKVENQPRPIYFEAKITDINMARLKEAREIEKKRQYEMFIAGPIAKPDEAADQGPLIPSDIVP